MGIEDGVERWIASRGRTVVEGGRAVRFTGTVRDVTAAKAAERALRESRERLRAALLASRTGTRRRRRRATGPRPGRPRAPSPAPAATRRTGAGHNLRL